MKTAARNVDNVNSTARVCVFLYFVGFSDFMLSISFSFSHVTILEDGLKPVRIISKVFLSWL